ncbi:MAG: hypothetical protein R3Y58_08370 [Eubacteriales bacterium]
MNEHTIKLLEECCSGSKMALSSLNQVRDYVLDDKLLSVMDTYKRKHERLEAHCTELLAECGKCQKEPGVMASTFSYITAEMKLMLRDDNHEIAKLMMDGCNMGIQSISKCHNDYPDASKDASDIAEDLIKIEEDFMKDLKQFI